MSSCVRGLGAFSPGGPFKTLRCPNVHSRGGAVWKKEEEEKEGNALAAKFILFKGDPVI